MNEPETPHSEIVEDDRLEAREALSDRLGSLWWTFLLRGILAALVGLGAIVIGLVLLIWPEGTARFAFALLGTFALISGAGSLLAWRRMPARDPERVTARNAGFAGLLIGLFLIFWPGSGLVALGWAIAFAAICVSAMMFWLAARFKDANQRLGTKVINPR